MIRYSKKEDAEDITKLANKYLYDCYLSELKNNKDAILMKHNIECRRKNLSGGLQQEFQLFLPIRSECEKPLFAH